MKPRHSTGEVGYSMARRLERLLRLVLSRMDEIWSMLFGLMLSLDGFCGEEVEE